jgi:hypothetical protein
MIKYTELFLSLFFLFSIGCKGKNNEFVVENNVELHNNNQVEDNQIEEYVVGNYSGIQPLPLGRYQEDTVAPNGKMLRVYIKEKKETMWGDIFSPIIYLYDKDGNELAIYDTVELLSEGFWPGLIGITYNKERNSFDMIFSLDAYGNYGTGYIDLNTNEYIRELLIVPKNE